MAVYKLNNAAGPSYGSLKLAEHYIYGSSRLGLVNKDMDIDQDKVTPVQETQLGNTYLLNFTRGNKLFEVTNHLGNVVMVLADLRTDKPRSNNPALVGNYNSVMVYASDYTPFGRAMAGRGYKTPTNYRYGFNGKEYHNDVQAAGNLLDYGNRLYDPMVGRFWSVDPLTKKYPELSSYQYASNNPIQNTDLDGLEGVARNLRIGEVAKGPLDPNRFPASNGWITNMPKLSNPVFTATFKMVAKEREIMMNNGLGTNYIGPESIVLDNIAIDRRNYSNAVLDNIRGGLGGTVGYWVGGERGSFYGAAADGVLFSFTGIQGNSRVLSRPQNVQTNQYTPSTESPIVNQSGGAYRASKFANNWGGGSLSETMKNFGVNPIGVRTESGKTIYTNAESGIQIIYDQGGNYFRINNANILGKRSYLSLDGSNPTNKMENGRTSGRTQDEYNQVTHFNNTDGKNAN